MTKATYRKTFNFCVWFWRVGAQNGRAEPAGRYGLKQDAGRTESTKQREEDAGRRPRASQKNHLKAQGCEGHFSFKPEQSLPLYLLSTLL